jgi:hypothetical protein
MIVLRKSLAAAGIAALVAGTVPNTASASDTAIRNPLQIERSAGTVIFAENKTKLKKVLLNNVILKGYDPVAYFNQGREAVRRVAALWQRGLTNLQSIRCGLGGSL